MGEAASVTTNLNRSERFIRSMVDFDRLAAALEDLPEEERFLAREFFRCHRRIDGRWVRIDDPSEEKPAE